MAGSVVTRARHGRGPGPRSGPASPSLFFLVCVAVAGAYGASTASRKILFVQTVQALTGPALVPAAHRATPADRPGLTSYSCRRRGRSPYRGGPLPWRRREWDSSTWTTRGWSSRRRAVTTGHARS
ncbi:DUF1304 family protein [Streptomyces tanashiensis]|uniref:DUF1304 family protein n=1 Tax=Streptomyces tanashiensis TaxID=67367 RepID=UPI0036E07E3B